MSGEIINITKEAGVLRHSLERGKLDLKQTLQFLARVERLNASPKVKKKSSDRFERQLRKL